MLLPPKKDVVLALLEQSSVYIHLDPRQKGVRVPPQFKKQPQLVLQVGLNMPIPIRDLDIDDAGISCTLSFNRSPFHCVMPYASIFALVGEDGRGMVWPDDVPPEVARQSQQSPKTKERPGGRPRMLRREDKRDEPEDVPKEIASERDVRTKIAIVPEQAAGEPETSAPAPGTPRKPKRELPPYLRVVK